MRDIKGILLWLFIMQGQCLTAAGEESSDLRLIPFPKQLTLHQGLFALDTQLVLETPAGLKEQFGEQVHMEFERASLPAPKVVPVKKETGYWRLAARTGPPLPQTQFRDGATKEDYVLEVRGNEVVCSAAGEAGLFYGFQTLLQLVRANRRESSLACLTIRDWPSLRWRCFQDDMTRGPSSKLATLKQHVDVGANLKMNLFTYYMEYQYAFEKHPVIGPRDGSLMPRDLAALVDYGRSQHVDILGNQQSFGHWARILAHQEYAHLRETDHIVTPVKEETYRLLDDLYSEVCPILPFAMFNVCCDETSGLGSGPSKTLADKIGVGGVYVRHVRRLHDLLQTKYGKRMMMWGDIILNHPDHLNEIPKDTIMLTWGYDARANFESQIIPFADSGYDFFVCPGIGNWSRILPAFRTSTTNICNFVRDGVKHGAIGMLNTAWEDDGEALQGYKWHGYAWGAECAWSGSATSLEDFNRRIGAVLFGEKDDHFGRAIQWLARHGSVGNYRFWRKDFCPTDSDGLIRAEADSYINIARPAIEELEACRRQATVNRDILDAFLLGARRIELIGQRRLDGLQTAGLYAQAYKADDKNALSLLTKAEKLVRKNRDAHEELGKEFKRIWLAESKPYALDWTMQRYTDKVKWYDDLGVRLAKARQAALAGKPLPSAEEVGL
jgi:hypothetical protein